MEGSAGESRGLSKGTNKPLLLHLPHPQEEALRHDYTLGRGHHCDWLGSTWNKRPRGRGWAATRPEPGSLSSVSASAFELRAQCRASPCADRTGNTRCPAGRAEPATCPGEHTARTGEAVRAGLWGPAPPQAHLKGPVSLGFQLSLRAGPGLFAEEDLHPLQWWSSVWGAHRLLSKEHAGSFKKMNFQILKFCIF